MAAISLTLAAPNPLLEKRGKKTILGPKYGKLLAEYLGTPYESYLTGLSPEGAAFELGITRQGVHLAIRRETLDAWYVLGKRSGDVVLRVESIHVTKESIRRYKASGRRRV